MPIPIRYIFWGTPEFAAVSLKALMDAGYVPFAVVTATDKVSGRGRKLTASPVKELALTRNIPVWQPFSLKDPDFVRKIKGSHPDFMVVVAFRMLPQEIIEIPKGGTWNLHASLLPDLRGAAPIHWALRLGYRRTGLTVFKIQYQIDTGDILASVQLDIPRDWNAGKLHDVMAQEGANLLVSLLPQIVEGRYGLMPQDKQSALSNNRWNRAPKIQRSDAAIDWNWEAQTLENFIRAFAPLPGAYTFLNGSRLVILEAKTENPKTESNVPTNDHAGLNYSGPQPMAHPPGYCLVMGNRWWIRAHDLWLSIKQIKPENSKAMTTEAYLRGHGEVNARICSKEF